MPLPRWLARINKRVFNPLRARGRVGGRPEKLADPKTVALAQKLYADGQTDVATIC